MLLSLAWMYSGSAFNPERTLLVGDDGISLERFLASPVEPWVWS